MRFFKNHLLPRQNQPPAPKVKMATDLYVLKDPSTFRGILTAILLDR